MRAVCAVLVTVLMSLANATIARAQSPIPVRVVSVAEATSDRPFATFVTSVREIANGAVLVNDGNGRQLVLLDKQLSNAKIVLDSSSTGGSGYGLRASTLIPYLGDSSLFIDGAALSMLVVDPFGKPTSAMSAPKPSDLRLIAGGAWIDAKDNFYYRGFMAPMQNRTLDGNGVMTRMTQSTDSAPVIRANLETRAVDTIARLKIQSNKVTVTRGENGQYTTRVVVNPFEVADEWAMLSDGVIGVVRGHDYHVDWIAPDGSKSASAKIPFEWRRMSDADKQSVLALAQQSLNNNAAQRAANARDANSAFPNQAPSQVELISAADLGDYFPPFRQGGVKSDLDGNIWVLARTLSQANEQELVYDVIASRGALAHRVKLPAGRTLVGFGKRGAVYMMYRDTARGWILERGRVGN